MGKVGRGGVSEWVDGGGEGGWIGEVGMGDYSRRCYSTDKCQYKSEYNCQMERYLRYIFVMCIHSSLGRLEFLLRFRCFCVH